MNYLDLQYNNINPSSSEVNDDVVKGALFHLYSPLTSPQIKQSAQQWLTTFQQTNSNTWDIARSLLFNPQLNHDNTGSLVDKSAIQFFGALTCQVKIVKDFSILQNQQRSILISIILCDIFKLARISVSDANDQNNNVLESTSFYVIAKLISVWTTANILHIGLSSTTSISSTTSSIENITDDIYPLTPSNIDPYSSSIASLVQLTPFIAITNPSDNFILNAIMVMKNALEFVSTSFSPNIIPLKRELVLKIVLTLLTTIPEEQSRAAINSSGSAKLAAILKNALETVFQLALNDILVSAEAVLQGSFSNQSGMSIDVIHAALNCCKAWLSFGSPPQVILQVLAEVLKLINYPEISQFALELLNEVISSPELRNVETTFCPIILSSFSSGTKDQNLPIGTLRIFFNNSLEEEDTQSLVSISKLLYEFLDTFGLYLLKVLAVDSKDTQCFNKPLKSTFFKNNNSELYNLMPQLSPASLLLLLTDLIEVVISCTSYGSEDGDHSVSFPTIAAWVVLAEHVNDMEFEFQIFSNCSSNDQLEDIITFPELGGIRMSSEQFKERIQMMYYKVFEVLINQMIIYNDEIWDSLTKEDRDQHWEFRRESFYTIVSTYEILGSDLLNHIFSSLKQQVEIFCNSSGSNWRELEIIISILRVLAEHIDFSSVNQGTTGYDALLQILDSNVLKCIESVQSAKHPDLTLIIKNSTSNLICEYSEWFSYTNNPGLLDGVLDYLVNMICQPKTSKNARIALSQICIHCNGLISKHTDKLLQFWIDHGTKLDFNTRSSLAKSLSELARNMPTESFMDRIGMVFNIVLDQISSALSNVKSENNITSDITINISESFSIIKSFALGILAKDSNGNFEHADNSDIVVDDTSIDGIVQFKTNNNSDPVGVDFLANGALLDQQLAVRNKLWKTIVDTLTIIPNNASVSASVCSFLKQSLTSHIPMLRMELESICEFLISIFSPGPIVLTMNLQDQNCSRYSVYVALAASLFGSSTAFRSRTAMDSLLGVKFLNNAKDKVSLEKNRQDKKNYYYPILARVAAVVSTSLSISFGCKIQEFMNSPEYVIPLLNMWNNISCSCPEIFEILTNISTHSIISFILNMPNNQDIPETSKILVSNLLELSDISKHGEYVYNIALNNNKLKQHANQLNVLLYNLESISLLALVTPDPTICRASVEMLTSFLSIPSKYPGEPCGNIIQSMISTIGSLTSYSNKDQQLHQVLSAVAQCYSISEVPFLVQVVIRVLEATAGAVPRSLDTKLAIIVNRIVTTYPSEARLVFDLILVEGLDQLVPSNNNYTIENTVKLAIENASKNCIVLAPMIKYLARIPVNKRASLSKEIISSRTAKKTTEVIKQIAILSRGLSNDVGYI